MQQPVSLTVHGDVRDLQVEPDTTLLQVLRTELELTAARFGCGLGQCGACLVFIDGLPVTSCDTPMWSVAGKAVTTVEGLVADGRLRPIQEAFLAEQAAQCGYCISGIMIGVAALLAEDPDPDEPAVVAALDRNLCRCGVQRRVVRAVLRAARAGG